MTSDNEGTSDGKCQLLPGRVADTVAGGGEVSLDEYVWVPDAGRRVIAPGDDRRCRMKGCGKQPVVMELQRTRWRSGGCKAYWWAYCAEHLYGSRIEGDRVLCRVHRDSPAGRDRLDRLEEAR